MPNSRALYWILALGLIAIGFTVNIVMAVAVAAAIGVYMVCDRIFFGSKVTSL